MKRTSYITRAGWHQLDEELKYLWREERPRVTQAVSEAAAQGDRSENAEYIYGKKRLREIDRRIRYLTKRFELLQIIDPSPQQEGKVFFGAWVKVIDDNDQQRVFRLVGTDEFDPAKQWISVDSPVARALVGKQVDDEIKVQTPGGEVIYTILAISYHSFDEIY